MARTRRQRSRQWLPLALAAGVGGLVVAGGAFALTRGGEGPPPTVQVRDITATQAPTPIPLSPSPTAALAASPTSAPTVTPAPTPPPTTASTPPPATPAQVQLSLPTEPARRIPIPDGIDPNARAVLAVLNLNGPAYIAAMRGPDEGPLRDAFTGPAYEQYAKKVAELRAAGQYEINDLVSISLTAFGMDGPDAAHASTVERWRYELYERSSGRRLRASETVYTEEYRFARVNGQWLTRVNTYTVVSTTPR